MRVARTALAALAVVAVGSVPTGPAGAQTTKTTLTPTTEAWYVPDRVCAAPVGCAGGVIPTPPATPGPARTMHVAVIAGQEIARTYMAFDLDKVQGDLSEGILTVPLDVGGSLSPEDADVIACTWAGTIANADASLQTPPVPNCRKFATMTYRPSPEPHFEGDLAPILEQLSVSSGIVLLPDAEAVTQTTAWHVVFSAHDREAALTPPAALALAATPTRDDESEPEFFAEPILTDPSGSTSFSAPPLDVTQPVATPPNAPAPAVVTPQVRAVFVPYAYPQIWLLPLVLMALVGAAGTVLTRDIKEL